MLFHFTLETATGFLFGESVESQRAAATGISSTTSAAAAMASDQSGNDMTFAEAFREAPNWIMTRVRLQGLYWLAPSRKGKVSDYLKRYTDYYISLAKPGPKKEEYVLLDTLVEQARNQDELRDQILALLMEGRDTTVTLLFLDISASRAAPGSLQKAS